jgi:hypothetical protein
MTVERKKQGKNIELFQFIVIGIGVVITLCIGYVGFWKYHHDHQKSILDLIYLTISLFPIQSGALEGSIPWELEVARFLAPALAAYTAILAVLFIFREEFHNFKLKQINNHVVICGLGRMGWQLTKDCLAEGKKVVILEKNEANEYFSLSKDLGAILIMGDATEERLLKKARVEAAEYLIIECGEDTTNVEITFKIYGLLKESGRGRKCTCFVHIVNLMLHNLIKRNKIFTDTRDRLEIRFFNVYQNSARLLLKEHPLDYKPISVHDGKQVHLVIIGFGQMGESLLLQAVRISHFANMKKLMVTIIDQRAEWKEKILFDQYPNLKELVEISFQQSDVQDPEVVRLITTIIDNGMFIPTIALCMDNDGNNFSLALYLNEKLKNRKVPIKIRMNDDTGVATLFREKANLFPQINIFGMMHQTCSFLNLKNETIDKVARERHERHVEKKINAGGNPDQDKFLVSWNELDEEIRDDNRSQVDHMFIKLRAIERYKNASLTNIPDSITFSAEEVELLARMEHARWCAYRYLEGWSYKPGEKDIKNKTSPYLLDYNQLEDNVKEWDRQPVKNIPNDIILFV